MVYESEPGTAVSHFMEDGNGVSFCVEGPEDAQIILSLADDTTYRVLIDGKETGMMETGMGGKLVLSVEMGETEQVSVKVEKA
jgi:hypothetical protein